MDQSCTAVHHHHYHRTPTWNWRRKEKLKPFLVPTHTELERLHQPGFPTPFLEQNSSCPATLCWTICLTTAPAVPETFYCSVTWQQISVYQPLCTTSTQELYPALWVSGQAGWLHREVLLSPPAQTEWHKPSNFKNPGQIKQLCRRLAEPYGNINSSPGVRHTQKERGRDSLDELWVTNSKTELRQLKQFQQVWTKRYLQTECVCKAHLQPKGLTALYRV